MVLYLLEKYPDYFIVNFDILGYSSSLEYLKKAESYPNYEFIKVPLLQEIEKATVYV